MSLIGPRPERPEFVETFAARLPRYRERMRVRPGLTGLAQVRGWRGDTSLEERLKSDLEYIARWSLALDALLLVRTPAALARGRRPIAERRRAAAG
jgi:lipopolysaccharide/colanic/teichoic acid biosynthesis glycosyltransferase